MGGIVLKRIQQVLQLLFIGLLVCCGLNVAWAAEGTTPVPGSYSGNPLAVSIDGFLGNVWGSNLDQVKKNMLARPNSGVWKINPAGFPPRAVGFTKMIAGYDGLGINTAINERQHFVVLGFYKDKLYRAYAEQEVSEANMFREFDTVADMLRQKYGEPREQSGKNTNMVRRWTASSGQEDGENSLRLSIEVVGPGTVHYITAYSYQTSPAERYFIVLEYEEGRTAALVAGLAGKSTPKNEY